MHDFAATHPEIERPPENHIQLMIGKVACSARKSPIPRPAIAIILWSSCGIWNISCSYVGFSFPCRRFSRPWTNSAPERT